MMVNQILQMISVVFIISGGCLWLYFQLKENKRRMIEMEKGSFILYHYDRMWGVQRPGKDCGCRWCKEIFKGK